VRSIVKKYNNVLLFILLFYLIMGISKYVQLLYFQANHHLENFAISYSTMAIAGALSFLVTNQLAMKQSRVYIKTFIPIYALGMLLRIVSNNSMIALISGALCGLGASAVLLLVRQWVLYLSDQDEVHKGFLQSSRFTLMQIASVLAMMLAGALVTILGKNNQAYVIVLVSSALAMLLILLLRIPEIEIPERSTNLFNVLPHDKLKGISWYLVSVLLGISSSVVSAILPAIIRGIGWSIWQTSVITTIATLLTLGCSFLFGLPRVSQRPGEFFLGTQLVIGLLAALLPLLIGINQLNLVFLALAIEASLAGFYILKEMMEYRLIPKGEALIYLGLIQSSFLVGDSLGSLLGSYLYNQFGVNRLFIVFAGFSLTATVLFYCFFKWYSRTIQ